ncbi:hypothetical protein C8J56DRAFT_1023431 [Mycena floridula]|nr:hypothetical protein C8J56DRAFT_1023431 [Mycena floridula]
MPALSSFITSYRPGRKKNKAGKAAEKIESPTSHPFASQEVFHITEAKPSHSYDFGTQSYQSYQSYQSFDESASIPTFSPVQPTRSPPHMKLDLEMSPEPLTDWIPAHLLSSDSEVYPTFTAIGGSEFTPEASGSRLEHEPSTAGDEASEPPGQRYDDDESGYEDDYDDYQSRSSMASEEIISNLQAMNASTFVNLTEPLDDPAHPFASPLRYFSLPSLMIVQAFPSYNNQSTTKAKKLAPSPIKIPSVEFNRPKLSLVRSATHPPREERERTISQLSMEEPEPSAVSGRTLARALIGNSFVLSSDQRTSRYRSGASNLTRIDSATLPNGEDPFLNSPYRYRSSVASDGTTPETSRRGSPLPPIPHPELYSPPTRKTSRHFSPEFRTELKNAVSIGSVLSPELSADSNKDVEEVNPTAFTSSRVSRISEKSSVPSTPENFRSNGGSSQSLVPSPLLLEPPAVDRPVSQLLSASSIVPPSTAPSSASLDVLDYYQQDSSPGLIPPPPPPPLPLNMAPTGFMPMFSPISEESSSQLSPPTPYNRPTSRQSSGGKLLLGMSPTRTGARIDFNVSGPRRQSRLDTALLPIGERPSSSQSGKPASFSKPGSIITSLAALDVLGPLAPPSISIFNRQRAGSTPSPIKVVRDEKDSNSYNLTVTPLPESNENTPSSEGGFAQQTFPETPSAFSPGWTPGLDASSGPEPEDDSPETPKSAALPTRSNSVRPSLAQRVLLTRAATSVHGARHSRQGSLTRPRTTAQPLYGRSISEDENDNVSRHDSDHDSNHSDGGQDDTGPILTPTSPQALESPVNASEHDHGQSETPSSPSMYSGTDHSHMVRSIPPPPPPPPPMVVQSILAKSANSSLKSLLKDNSSQKSLILKDKDLPQLPPPTPIPIPSLPVQEETLQPTQTPTPDVSPPQSATPTAELEPEPESESEPEPETETEPAVVVTPPVALPPSPHSASFVTRRVEPDLGSPSALVRTFGSPPPYDAVSYEKQYDNSTSSVALTPTSGGRSATDTHFNLSSPVFSLDSPRGPGRMTRESSTQGRRMRPPLPAGPRRPSNDHARQRNGSVSSLGSSLLASNSRRRLGSFTTALQSPKFQTPAVKWRGHTMDAAKWTFSSAQLQSIVSRAIRQSSEASSIRLLRLETLDNDIPDEIRRLEMQRTDIKSRYKMMTRRRGELLNSLLVQIDGPRHEDSTAAIRAVEDLKDTSILLDKLAEDLHSVDEQLAQLQSLREVHSASALAMALRKLNASFLKQLAETQALREQVGSLTEERDEAWKQAESLANEYDHLNKEKASNRSSRVMASRKSSIRVSKAGLRSARSSMSSFRMSMSIPSGAKSAFSVEDIPPVPPIPRRKPMEIYTDLPTHSSPGIFTADGFTPSSETRAMVRAHEELCDMLGISITDTRTRRTRSVMGRSREDSDVSTSYESRRQSHSSSGRPTSLPGSSQLSEVYNTMSADGNAMLTTLEILADMHDSTNF